MDITALSLIIIVILIVTMFALTKSGRKFMFSWKHKLFGEVNAEAENIHQMDNRPEQILEESHNVEQEMVGATGGKQVSKNSRNSSQKIT